MLEWLTYQVPMPNAADVWTGCAWLLVTALACCILEVTVVLRRNDLRLNR